jgi:hypothetical protein
MHFSIKILALFTISVFCLLTTRAKKDINCTDYLQTEFPFTHEPEGFNSTKPFNMTLIGNVRLTRKLKALLKLAVSTRDLR